MAEWQEHNSTHSRLPQTVGTHGYLRASVESSCGTWQSDDEGGPKNKWDMKKADSERLCLCFPASGEMYPSFRKSIWLNRECWDFVVLKQILLLPWLICLSPRLCSWKCWQFPISVLVCFGFSVQESLFRPPQPGSNWGFNVSRNSSPTVKAGIQRKAPPASSFCGEILKNVPYGSSEGVELKLSIAMCSLVFFSPSCLSLSTFSFVFPGMTSQIKTACTYILVQC